MPTLTTVSEGSETLSTVSADTETLTAIAVVSETLTALWEQDFGYAYFYPSASSYPSSTSYPGTYGDEVGFRLTTLAEGSETLTILSES